MQDDTRSGQRAGSALATGADRLRACTGRVGAGGEHQGAGGKASEGCTDDLGRALSND
jgi:hypothetical protein